MTKDTLIVVVRSLAFAFGIYLFCLQVMGSKYLEAAFLLVACGFVLRGLILDIKRYKAAKET
ncbi:hypothetical protein A3715_11410 [Oleiphilus sp. HI0009]|nr:hypothetical protein A3715_11410 [Oleiphilus sp. HI0009]